MLPFYCFVKHWLKSCIQPDWMNILDHPHALNQTGLGRFVFHFPTYYMKAFEIWCATRVLWFSRCNTFSRVRVNHVNISMTLCNSIHGFVCVPATISAFVSASGSYLFLLYLFASVRYPLQNQFCALVSAFLSIMHVYLHLHLQLHLNVQLSVNPVEYAFVYLYLYLYLNLLSISLCASISFWAFVFISLSIHLSSYASIVMFIFHVSMFLSFCLPNLPILICLSISCSLHTYCKWFCFN